MPSTNNKSQSSRSNGLFYTPPHLRTGNANIKTSTNQNATRCTDNKSMIDSKNSAGDLGIEESFSRLSIPPRCRRYDFGISTYFDCRFKGSQAEYRKKLEKSTTLYVGNLNLNTTQSDVQKLFSKAGNIKAIKMGIDKKTSGPGGFCFIEYETRAEAEKCKNKKDIILNGNKVCVDWDAGYSAGRQYTRRRPTGAYTTTQKVNSRTNHLTRESQSSMKIKTSFSS